MGKAITLLKSPRGSPPARLVPRRSASLCDEELLGTPRWLVPAQAGGCRQSWWVQIPLPEHPSVPLHRSSRWDTARRASGSRWEWRAATWKCCTTRNPTSTSCTSTRAASSPSSLPTAVSGAGPKLGSSGDSWGCTRGRRQEGTMHGAVAGG